MASSFWTKIQPLKEKVQNQRGRMKETSTLPKTTKVVPMMRGPIPHLVSYPNINEEKNIFISQAVRKS